MKILRNESAIRNDEGRKCKVCSVTGYPGSQFSFLSFLFTNLTIEMEPSAEAEGCASYGRLQRLAGARAPPFHVVQQVRRGLGWKLQQESYRGLPLNANRDRVKLTQELRLPWIRPQLYRRR